MEVLITSFLSCSAYRAGRISIRRNIDQAEYRAGRISIRQNIEQADYRSITVNPGKMANALFKTAGTPLNRLDYYVTMKWLAWDRRSSEGFGL